MQRQFRELRKGGISALVRKVYVLILTLLAPFVVVAMRGLRPFVVIRFGKLHSSRIGHFVYNTEVYLCMRDAGMFRRKTIDIFYNTPPVCNQQLEKMWRRKLRIVDSVRYIDRINGIFPGNQRHRVPLGDGRDAGNFTSQRNQPHLIFTPEEERDGEIALAKLGIAHGVPFIPFHAREDLYLKTIMDSYDESRYCYRNSDIRNFLDAAEELTRRGYVMVRMGAAVKEPLVTSNQRIIDYARNGRTDFLDIFLAAKCRFFLGSHSGITGVSMAFYRPVAWVNCVPLEYVHTWRPKDLFIPKKIWLRREKRLMTFSEIIKSGVGRFYETEQYERQGIEAIENTTEEITALAIEMDERLCGRWQTNSEDEGLQKHFWSLFEGSQLHGKILSRIGAEFLRQNRDLLDY